ncbi:MULTISPECIES: diguanylate cyclase [Anaerostipes]|uniref:Diguanylate cyclase n=1 Tax=Anaerostipes hominis (ex Lee et al. 2021) TaxID=2025494 RepID=A0ABV4DM01_9FIRM|nr:MULTISPECIES: diguanylate cyclase [Anaerostipes]
MSRHAFLKKVENCLAAFAVLALRDIDDFKIVNDTWGHFCGDKILSEPAELICSFLGGDVDVCRWGGAEFIFLFRDTPLEDVLIKL